MLWARKRPVQAPARNPADIMPAELPVALDVGVFGQHFQAFVETAAGGGGAEVYLERLTAKQRLCADTLASARGRELDIDSIARLLGFMFTARRHLMRTFEDLGARRCTDLLCDLGQLTVPPVNRMQRFVDAMPGAPTPDPADRHAAGRLRRAAWDFAAEIVHFSDPVRFPLMTHWVWDNRSQSGALREFIRGNDAMREIPFDNSAELHEGARVWLSERVLERGIYRDVPLWIDLVLAQAYVSYVRAIASGSLGGEFGRGMEVPEQLSKLLGIDADKGRLPRAAGTAEDAHVRANGS